MRDASSGYALSDMTEVNDKTHAPDARWLQEGDDWVLELIGDWRGHRAPLPDLPAADGGRRARECFWPGIVGCGARLVAVAPAGTLRATRSPC